MFDMGHWLTSVELAVESSNFSEESANCNIDCIAIPLKIGMWVLP